MKQLYEIEIEELKDTIRKKEEKIEDLLQRLDNLAMAYAKLANQVTKTNTDMSEDATITKEDFLEYEELRTSGDFNMLDPAVREAIGITKEEHKYIIKNYGTLAEIYLK